MKDPSFFLLKNSLGAKMKKGIRTFCNDDGSTSTLNQQNKTNHGDSTSMVTPFPVASPYNSHNSNSGQSTTLEEMILQLELEEEVARKAKLNDRTRIQGRMSCVNNSDILRSARNALNQYPRFSLDGKDAMYRSSFRNMSGNIEKAERKSISSGDHALRGRFSETDFDSKLERNWTLPQTLAGESVVWCQPGVVAKLMGLEAMPVPLSSKDGKQKLSSIIKKQNLRRREERHEVERRLAMDINCCNGIKRGRMASCSRTGYCVMKPVAMEPTSVPAVWPIRRFL
ncbi:hypothetical protein F2P56_033568 [Juglans regia]|uniref:Uncharacterized protein LOC109003417 n=2 Tax=Juglans regia TaxID=51240 RepID=A0A2I4FZJ8_JUGRE|nr:uncharacterized protein LOC109003417 [Juglans regia]KAF5448068.1 hypothetical protein F2P56_033568 [Juglans regia]